MNSQGSQCPVQVFWGADGASSSPAGDPGPHRLNKNSLLEITAMPGDVPMAPLSSATLKSRSLQLSPESSQPMTSNLASLCDAKPMPSESAQRESRGVRNGPIRWHIEELTTACLDSEPRTEVEPDRSCGPTLQHNMASSVVSALYEDASRRHTMVPPLLSTVQRR